MALDVARSAEPSAALRSAFSAHTEAWLRDLQALIDAEVCRCRAELQHEIVQRRKDLDAEWAVLMAERENLQQERAAIIVREEALDREKATLQGRCSPHDVLDLNIGGQAGCSVKRSTLCIVEDSALSSMFSGRWEASLDRDASGRVYVDFSPDLFLPLLDYLRQKSIEDPADPVEPPDVPHDRLCAFKRMVTYYGLVDTIWPSPEGKWEPAWGHIQIDEEDKSISVTAQRDTYQAAAFNTLRLRRSSHLSWKLIVFKTRADVPWYYDSVAFGIVKGDGHRQYDMQVSQSSLMLNLRGEVGDEFPSASIDLGGGMPAEQSSLKVEMKLKSGRFVLAIGGREHISTALPGGVIREPLCCLLVAVTYPWIRVQLCV